MRIGIDIGGSHIGVGLVKGSKLICKKEIVLTKEDKKNIEENIVKNTIELLNQVIEETNIKLDNIVSVSGFLCPKIFTSFIFFVLSN